MSGGILYIQPFKTAGDLGIEIGIFNSPGWSQSGGPWVKPAEAMRYLTSSELLISGPKNITVKLEKPAENFQDVKVIAYPAPKENNLTLSKNNIQLNANSKVVLDFDTSSDFTVRSVSIYPKTQPINAQAEFQVKKSNGYQTISTFDISRYNPALNVGFDPYGPVVITIPTTSAKSYRLIVNNTQASCGLEKVGTIIITTGRAVRGEIIGENVSDSFSILVRFSVASAI